MGHALQSITLPSFGPACARKRGRRSRLYTEPEPRKHPKRPFSSENQNRDVPRPRSPRKWEPWEARTIEALNHDSCHSPVRRRSFMDAALPCALPHQGLYSHSTYCCYRKGAPAMPLPESGKDATRAGSGNWRYFQSHLHGQRD